MENLELSRVRGCSSKYKGVMWAKARKKWVAYYLKGNKSIYIGGFTDEIEAAKAYQKRTLEEKKKVLF